MSFVCVDIGASSTRYGNSAASFGVIPNNVCFITKYEGGKKVVDLNPVACNLDSSELLDNLELIIEHPNEFIDTSKHPMEKLFTGPNFPVHVTIGNLASILSGVDETPKVYQSKTGQLINYVSLIAAVALSRLTGKVDEHLNLHMALPPQEASARRTVLNDYYKGEYTVNFVRVNGGTKVHFIIDSVECFPESSAALTSFLLNLDGSPSENYRKYGNKCIMSVDIGASTSDTILMENGTIVEKTGKTHKTGGKAVVERVRDKLMAFYPDVQESDAQMAVAEGRIHAGGDSYDDVSGIVDEAKREVAAILANEMDSYLNSIQRSLRSINVIVVSGGGSLHSQYIDENNNVVESSAPMSKFFTEYLTGSYPIEVINHSNNPRMANVTGLFIRARTKEAIEARKKAQAQNQGQAVDITVSAGAVDNQSAPEIPKI